MVKNYKTKPGPRPQVVQNASPSDKQTREDKKNVRNNQISEEDDVSEDEGSQVKIFIDKQLYFYLSKI
jgi:hypothetical protein